MTAYRTIGCLDGNLFNIRRLQAKTKTFSEHVFKLQYIQTMLPFPVIVLKVFIGT